jgi:glycosyltransferase involved in cell wall biosynthesis
MITLGVPQSGYNVDRNILGSMPARMRRVRPVDRHRLGTAIRHRLRSSSPPSTTFVFSSPFFPRVDLLHFFNTVTDADVPWITTFETMVPRWLDASEAARLKGCGWLMRPACKRLIAFSDAARNCAVRDWAGRLTGEQVETLARKVTVLLPPQVVTGRSHSPSSSTDVSFAFVGSEFYRKGGLATLDAFARLLRAGVSNWRLVVIGRLDSFGDYASGTGVGDRERAVALIRTLGDRCVHHERLASADVRGLFARSDYHILPTLADTFGYSILEAKSLGAIPITTNVRSLPEIVDEESGHVVSLPLDGNRDAHTNADMTMVKERLVDTLVALLAACCSTSDVERTRKREAGYEQLRARHCPAKHAETLAAIYAAALGG